MYYWDSSSAVKLIVPEAESALSLDFLARHPAWVSSALLRVEMTRALARTMSPELRRERAAEVLDGAVLITMSDAILAHAAALEPPQMRALDAIHLATALSIPNLDGIVTYDRRLGDAAEAAGLRVFSPA